MKCSLNTHRVQDKNKFGTYITQLSTPIKSFINNPMNTKALKYPKNHGN